MKVYFIYTVIVDIYWKRNKRNGNSQVYQIILNRSKVLKEEEKQYWKLFFFQSR